MIDFPCSHKKLIEIGGRLFCENCDLEFEPPTPLCSCFIVEKNGENICTKCGSVYDDFYLRKSLEIEHKNWSEG